MCGQPLLGLSLRDVAKQTGATPTHYLSSMARHRWGGFREALLLALASQVQLTIWSPSGQIVLQHRSRWWHPQLHLLYTGQHYLVIKPVVPWSRSCQRGTPTSLHTGGGPGDGQAAVKARIAQKLTSQGVSAAGQLVHLLW